MNKITNIDALILAGGKSTRMNFTDKALLQYNNNKNFLEKITDELEDFEHLMVSINKEQNFLIPRGEIVTDKQADIGPLEGIYQGLLKSKSNFVFVTTCDMPNITKDFIRYMTNFISNDYDAVIIKDKIGKTYPLFGIYSKSALNTIERFIMDKNYRIFDVLDELKVKYLDLSHTTFDIKKLLQNIDTAEDLKNLTIFMGNKPFICISGAKGVGKTTLIQELTSHFKDAGLKVATIKHNCNFNTDNFDEDINLYKKSGAAGTLLFSKDSYVLLKDRLSENLFDYLKHFKECDLILMEDFKHEPFPKIEIIKKDISSKPVANPKNLLFYVTDVPEILENDQLESYGLNDSLNIFKRILNIANIK